MTGRARTAAATRPLSPTKRKTMATQHLVSMLGPNQALAVTAALELAQELASNDTSIQERLRQKYQELETFSNGQGGRAIGAAPIPIKSVGIDRYDPYGKLDPYTVLDRYGREHVRAVLGRATQRSLREAVDIVQSRNPGTRPVSRARNADMIEYIVEQVAGPGY